MTTAAPSLGTKRDARLLGEILLELLHLRGSARRRGAAALAHAAAGAAAAAAASLAGKNTIASAATATNATAASTRWEFANSVRRSSDGTAGKTGHGIPGGRSGYQEQRDDGGIGADAQQAHGLEDDKRRVREIQHAGQAERRRGKDVAGQIGRCRAVERGTARSGRARTRRTDTPKAPPGRRRRSEPARVRLGAAERRVDVADARIGGSRRML